MDITKTVKKAFETVSGVVSTASGESYATGQAIASYVSTAISAKISNKK